MSADPAAPAGSTKVFPAGDPFLGGGEAGAVLRAIDWSTNCIGPVATWPQSLLTALSICLASRHPICIIWGPERIYFYNDAYTPILGAKHPWALGENYINVWPEIWETSIRPILESVEQTGRASWCDDLLLVLRRNGYNEECYFSFSFAPTRIEDGSIGGVFTAITETTSRVVGERRLRTLRDLGAQLPESKSAEDACRLAGEVLAANPLDVPFALFYLISADGKSAQRAKQTGRDDDSPAVPKTVSLTDENAPDIWGFRNAITDGKAMIRGGLTALPGALHGGTWPEPVVTAMVLPIVRPGEPVPFGFVVAGTSPRRPLDSDYQTFLSTITSHLALAVSNTRARAEEQRRMAAIAELDRAKTDFFSNVSHEFRTPLTLMLGPLEELMGGKTNAPLAPDVRERLNTTHRNSLRLLKLVNTLLDFSSLEAGRLEPNYEAVDLAELTTELGAMFRPSIEAAGLRLIVDCESAAEPAYVDRNLWEKIVLNLLSNACKFTHEGEIEVSLRRLPTVFQLRVRDTGIGIAPEDHAAVFKRFHRVQHARSRTHEGSGIGLSLVQELVRLHGGTIELVSAPGQGSTFTVTIPVRRAFESERAAKPPVTALFPVGAAFVAESMPVRSASESRNAFGNTRSAREKLPRILVADDNADMRAYIQRLLQERYHVEVAENGEAALEAMYKCRPQLVLADVMMPGLDGIALVTAARADERIRTIPIILLSARAGEDAQIEGIDAGADDYLTKPFTARELLSRVQSHLRLVEMRQSVNAQLSASAARIEQLIEMMPAGVLACDACEKIVFFNRRAEEIWGASPAPHESFWEFANRFELRSAGGTPIRADEMPITRALREGATFDNEDAVVIRPNGSRFIAHFNVRPTVNSSGETTGTIVVFQDVTAERDAQIALQQTQERYRAVFQQAAVGIFECDFRGRIVRSNPALSRIMGWSEEELSVRSWRDLAHPEELAAESELVSRLLRSEIGSITAQSRFLRKDGSFGWLDVFATLIRDEAGAPSYGLGVVVDISQRKRAEAEARESEDRFREAADSAPVLIWIADADKRFTWFNQPWLEFVGRTLEQECGSGWTENVHLEDRGRYLDIYNSAFDRRESFSLEYRLRRHDGEYRWLLENGVPRFRDLEFAGYTGSCIDITDRRAAEEAMNESRNAERARRQELEVLTQIAPAGIWMARDPNCEEITGNAAAHAMVRVPPGRNLSRSQATEPNAAVAFFHEGKPIQLEDMAMRVAARTGQTVMNQELEFRFADGTSTWGYGSATPLMGEDGKVRGVICVMVDVTEWKRVEAALRFSENQLRLITDHTAVMLAQLDRNHRYRFVNRTYCERYGRSLEQLIGAHVREVIGESTYETAKPHIAKALAGEATRFELYYPTFSRWGDVVYEPERAADGTIVGLVAVVIDITERKRAEIELQRARDEALAASRAKDDFLAALSHELRTPLSPVLLLASEAATDMKLPVCARNDFGTIRKCVELEARLIDDLLDLTRITRGKLVLDQGELDLWTVVHDALGTVSADLDAKQINLVVEKDDVGAWVWGDPVRLQQVFWNILKNAVKFTPWGGRVTVSCLVDVAAGIVTVTVTDTGIGITTGELARVFEAFSQGDHANTSGSHRFGGLGLGLAISRRVVELHNGRIGATSAGRDHGATFRVELPLVKSALVESDEASPTVAAAEKRAVSRRQIANRPDSAMSGRIPGMKVAPPLIGRILLVEDHGPTRVALEQLLIRRNYAVRSAASTADARALAKQESFAVLISDIGLPDGNGYELMKEFHETYGMIGISLTGYGMEEDVSRSQYAGFLRHLTKPIRIQSLDEALATLRSLKKPK